MGSLGAHASMPSKEGIRSLSERNVASHFSCGFRWDRNCCQVAESTPPPFLWKSSREVQKPNYRGWGCCRPRPSPWIKHILSSTAFHTQFLQPLGWTSSPLRVIGDRTTLLPGVTGHRGTRNCLCSKLRQETKWARQRVAWSCKNVIAQSKLHQPEGQGGPEEDGVQHLTGTWLNKENIQHHPSQYPCLSHSFHSERNSHLKQTSTQCLRTYHLRFTGFLFLHK